MIKMLKFIKNAIYFTVITILGIFSFFGEPIAYFIIGIWSGLTSFALYNDNISLLKILHADFSINIHKQEGLIQHLRGAKFAFGFSLVMFILGLLFYCFPRFFS
jgi:hypothetical protein